MIQDITKKDKKEQNFGEKLLINLYDFAGTLTTSLIIIMLIFTFVFRVVGVSGTSMVPTLDDGDWLLCTAYDSEPEYGQVVIITQPNWFNEPIVKRIIATENQTVDIDFETGEVKVDGVVLDEPYINNLTTIDEGVEFPVTVPEGCVFVMGDNRQGSTDSRSEKIGFVMEEYILGVAKYKIFNRNSETGATQLVPFSEWKVQ